MSIPKDKLLSNWTIELHKRAEKFSGLFRDMLLDKDAIENVKLFEDAAFFSPTAFTSAQ